MFAGIFQRSLILAVGDAAPVSISRGPALYNPEDVSLCGIITNSAARAAPAEIYFARWTFVVLILSRPTIRHSSLERGGSVEKSAALNRSVGANRSRVYDAYDCVHLKRVISVLQVVSTLSCTVSIVQPAAAFYLSFNRQTLRSEHSTSAWILSIMHSAETICSLQRTCTPSAACISYSTLHGRLSRSGSFRNHRQSFHADSSAQYSNFLGLFMKLSRRLTISRSNSTESSRISRRRLLN